MAQEVLKSPSFGAQPVRFRLHIECNKRLACKSCIGVQVLADWRAKVLKRKQ